MSDPASRTTKQRRAEYLIDEMLSAQTRFATAHRDTPSLTEQQRRDEATRDKARAELMTLVQGV